MTASTTWTPCHDAPPTPHARGRRRPRIPVRRQRAASDCAVTCLGMVLSLHGRPVEATELERLLPTGRDGHSALSLLQAASHHGLQGRGLRVHVDALAQLEPGTILHWDGDHFVVLERVTTRRGRKTVHVVDPALGRCQLDQSQVARRFSGIAVELWPGDTFERRARTRAGYGRYTKILTRQPRLLAATMTLSALLMVASLTIPVLTALVVDWLIPSAHTVALGAIMVCAVLVVVGQGVLSCSRALVLVRLHELFDRRLVSDFLDRLLSLPYAFFQQRSAGDLMMRLGSTAQIREALTNGAISAVMDGTLVVGYLVLLLVLSPQLTAVVVVLAALQLGHFAWSGRKRTALAAHYLSAEAESRGYQARMLMGIETLKATGCEREASGHFHRLFERVLAAGRVRGRFNAWVDGVAASLRLAGPLALLGVGAAQVMSGEMALGTMLGASQLAMAFLAPLAALVATATGLQVTAGHVDRLEEVYRTEPEQVPAARRTPTMSGAVSLRGVGFRYSEQSPWVIDDFDLEIKAGQHVALVGASGSGKSTLARIIVGLSRPQRGDVFFDGTPLSECDLGHVRRHLGVVTQDARLFDMTIADNIALAATGATQDDIRNAAIRARIHDEIMALPMGYQTRLADGGSALSGGQRQRLTLARALVRHPRVLVLDEATSALDSVTEVALQRALDQLECTVVTVAHRMSTIRNADCIVVLADGKVVGRGPHDALLASCPAYSELVRAQLAPSPRSSCPAEKLTCTAPSES